MIICKRERLALYAPMLPGIKNALASLNSLGPSPLPCRVEFEGGFLFVQQGHTGPVAEGAYEAHRRYIDVQVMLYGCERVFWNDIGNMAPKGAYDEAKDKLALEGEAALSADILPSTCWAAFPEDAHMACRDMGERRDFLKAVIKLEIPKGKEA